MTAGAAPPSHSARLQSAPQVKGDESGLVFEPVGVNRGEETQAGCGFALSAGHDAVSESSASPAASWPHVLRPSTSCFFLRRLGLSERGRADRRQAPRASKDNKNPGPFVQRMLYAPARPESGRPCGNLAHLRRPCLVKRTNCSGNHPGPMKALVRSRYATARDGSGWARSDHQPLCRGWPSAAEHSFRNMPTIIDCAITRVG